VDGLHVDGPGRFLFQGDGRFGSGLEPDPDHVGPVWAVEEGTLYVSSPRFPATGETRSDQVDHVSIVVDELSRPLIIDLLTTLSRQLRATNRDRAGRRS